MRWRTAVAIGCRLSLDATHVVRTIQGYSLGAMVGFACRLALL